LKKFIWRGLGEGRGWFQIPSPVGGDIPVRGIEDPQEGCVIPLTKKGSKIKKAMTRQYGKRKGEEVFYASENKGTIKGVHKGGKKRKKGY
jgi:hypothetical protein